MGGSVGPALPLHIEKAGHFAPAGLASLETYLGSLLRSGFPPGLSLAVLTEGSSTLAVYGGLACEIGETVLVAPSTAFDLASLTKVVCTTSLAVLAAQEGLLGLGQPVRRWLPEFPGPSTTVLQLLTHTSGLVDHRPFFATMEGRAQIEAAVYAEAASAAPGATVTYSDLNFMLLGWVLEAAYGNSLDEAFAVHVARPLGLGETGFNPRPDDRCRTAATELDGDQRRSPGLVWGEVHDGNAWALGGVAGHAGLFAPMADLCRFVEAILGTARGPFSEATLALLSRRHAGGGEDVRSLGWRLEPPAQWGRWPSGTMWHTGFTGTSLLIAPSLGAGVVLLTNAVHPNRRLDEQARMRADIHRLISEVIS